MIVGGGDDARRAVPGAKIAVPRVPQPFLPRPRLLARLDARVEGQLSVVCAPAGYGKTLTLADWARRRPECVAWVSLDETDNDPGSFWAAVLASLARCPAVPERAGPAGLTGPLDSATGDGPVTAVVAALVNALAEADRPVALVLDDVHEIISPESLRGLAALVRHRPPQLHVLLSGRTDPPLHLARLRLSGELHEVRARDLRFSVAEAALVLAQADVDVRPDQVRLLVDQTEGWPAGVRLAAMSLRTHDDADRFLVDFAANDRAVAEYLVCEILDRLPADVCDFLRDVSVCDQLTGELAATLAGRADAPDMLDALEAQTSLVLSVGDTRTSHRVHPLLRAHLRADLRRRHPDRLAALHARAAGWYLTAGRHTLALAHAAEAGDPALHLRVLAEQAVAIVGRGQHALLRRHLDRAGPPEDPRVTLLSALLAVEDGYAEAVAIEPARARRLPVDGSPEVAILRAVIRSRRAATAGGPHALLRVAAEFAAVAAAGTDAAGRAAAAVPALLLDLAVALGERGDTGRAGSVARDALQQAQQAGHGLTAARGRLLLADLACAAGDLRESALLAERAGHALAATGHEPAAELVHARALQGLAALLGGAPADALELVAPAARLVEPTGAGDELRAVLPMAPLLLAVRGTAALDLGRESAALGDLHSAGALAARPHHPATPASLAAVAVLVHAGAAATGRHQLARTLLTWARDAVGGTGEILLLQARRQVHRGRHAAAAELLDGLRGGLADGSVPALCPWTATEVEVLACHLALLADRRTAARQALERALELVAVTDLLRPLAVAPPEVVDLLIRGLGGYGAREPVAVRALEVHAALPREHAPVRLTDRERAVLRLLPTQRSIHEIAEDLTVSESTVKTHVRAIYGKLGVNSRRDAVAVAHRRGVIERYAQPG
ncbi:MAG: LuxR C-terminal-related transcriptional regulator [Pseudonocardia sp.]